MTTNAMQDAFYLSVIGEPCTITLADGTTNQYLIHQADSYTVIAEQMTHNGAKIDVGFYANMQPSGMIYMLYKQHIIKLTCNSNKQDVILDNLKQAKQLTQYKPSKERQDKNKDKIIKSMAPRDPLDDQPPASYKPQTTVPVTVKKRRIS